MNRLSYAILLVTFAGCDSGQELKRHTGKECVVVSVKSIPKGNPKLKLAKDVATVRMGVSFLEICASRHQAKAGESWVIEYGDQCSYSLSDRTDIHWDGVLGLYLKTKVSSP